VVVDRLIVMTINCTMLYEHVNNNQPEVDQLIVMTINCTMDRADCGCFYKHWNY
jgi:hypothetical protein